MTTHRQSKQVVARMPTPSMLNGSGITAIRGDYTTVAGIIINDVIEMGNIPADAQVVDVILTCEDLDSNGSPTITLDGGIISGTPGAVDNTRTCGTEFFAAATTGQAGGVAHTTKATATLLAPSYADRAFGLLIKAAAATLVVGAKISMTVLVKSQDPDAVIPT